MGSLRNRGEAPMTRDTAQTLVRDLCVAECEATKRGRVTIAERRAILNLLEALCPEQKWTPQDIEWCLP
jgi:hypothetical protein